MFKLDSETLLQKVGNEAVLLDLKQGVYFQLNETGTHIVDGLVGGKDNSQLVQLLCNEFKVEPEVAQKDIDELIQDLEAHELIQKV